MSLNYFLRVLILSIVFCLSSSMAFADTSDWMNDAMAPIMGPTETISLSKLPDGSIMTTTAIRGYDAYSVGTITKDRESSQVVMYTAPDQSQIIAISNRDNTTTTLYRDSSGNPIKNSDGTIKSETRGSDGTIIANYDSKSATNTANNIDKGSIVTSIFAAERVPGATCNCDTANGQKNEGACPSSVKVEDRRYSCIVEQGLSGFQNIFREIIRFIINITLLLGVLAVVGLGILWTWGSESEEYTKKVKGWLINLFIGLFILFTFRYILLFLAPWIFQ